MGKYGYLLFCLLCLWTACRDVDRRSVILAKLPSHQVPLVDSLLQIEESMTQSNLLPDIVVNMQREIAWLLMDRAPEESLFYLKKVQSYHSERENIGEVADLHLLMARIYDEKLRQYESALEQLAKAEAISRDMNDGIRLATVLQYQGVLEAKLGRTEAGIQKAKEAIELFQEEQSRDGVLTGFYDLARIAGLAGEPAVGLTYIDEALADWRAQRAYRQIVPANNLRFRLLLQDGQLEEAARVQAENDSLIKRTQAPWPLQLPFLQLSRELFERTGRLSELDAIRKSYRLLTDSLETERLVYFEE